MDGKQKAWNIRNTVQLWISRFSGVVFAVGGIYGFIQDTLSSGEFAISEALLGAIIFSIGFWLIYIVSIGLPVYLIVNALESARKKQNPFYQGVEFILSFVTAALYICALFDYVFSGGSFLIIPVVELISSGTLEYSFWQCEDWVMGEGPWAYCADDMFGN